MTYELAPERVVARIRSRIQVAPNGCWIWPGAKGEGYGRIAWTEDGRKFWRGTHRVMYESAHGPLAADIDVDHVCHDPATCSPSRAVDCPHRACCNPKHLRAATRRENLLRGATVSAERRAVETCPRGHEYSDENTIVSPKGQRSCRACAYERNRAYYWKNKERRAAYNRAWRAKRAASQEG